MNHRSAELTVFDARFPDEASAVNWLVERRWPNGPQCPECGSMDLKRITTRPQWWRCRTCKHHTSLRSGTPLHGTRKPLRDWVYVLWRASRYDAVSAKQLQRDLGYSSYETVWSMAQKVRAALMDDGAPLLMGRDILVTFGWLGALRHANGDPPHRPNVRVTICIDQHGIPRASDQCHIAVSDGDPDLDALIEAVTEWCVAPGRDVIEADRYAGEAEAERVERRRVTQQALLDLARWISRQHGGVSSRYLPNYVAQWLWVARAEPSHAALGERILREPPRPRRDLAGYRLPVPGPVRPVGPPRPTVRPPYRRRR